MNFNVLTRKLHRWGAIVFALPLLVVILSGLLLQVKKQLPWVQPPSQRGTSKNTTPQLEWSQFLSVSKETPEANVSNWEDINRIYIEPGKGIAKVICENNWEIQIDLQSGDVLSSAQRRSDLIESLHDGSFFSQFAKIGVFLPNGIVLLILWFTGVWLWYLPMRAKKRRKLSLPTQ